MLYHFVKPFAKIALKIHFKKIYFSNADRIPWGKPIILAVNHPTSFIEPCLLAAYLPRSLHFLARGDLFKKPGYSKILASLHILPVFRLKDGGYGKIKNNYATLAKCFDALKEKKTILIMAEGNCIQEKRLRPLRKGTARLAFGTYEKYGDLDVQIVPVGVNYTYPDGFRAEAMFDFGEPIAVTDYLQLYNENPNEAFRQITDELEVRLRKRIVIIEDKDDEDLTESLLVMNRTNYQDELLPLLSTDSERLSREMAVAKRVGQLPDATKHKLKRSAANYFDELEVKEITDEALMNPGFGSLSNLIVLIAGGLPFLLGYLGNFLPMWYAGHIKDTQVKEVEDKMSVAIAVGLGGYLVYYLLLIILGFVLNSMTYWIMLAMLPLWGYFALVYMSFYKKYKVARKAQSIDISTMVDLKLSRRKILEQSGENT